MSLKAEKILKKIFNYYCPDLMSPEDLLKQCKPKESSGIGFGFTLYDVAQALVELKEASK